MIQRLDINSIQTICANQVVTDLCGCIKELVENSIDANSTRIEVFLTDYGKDTIEVKDNGSGIDQENLLQIAQKGATSKLENFEKLNDVTTYGFRGEALNSISKLSNLTIISRIAKDELGWKFVFNLKGELVEQVRISCDKGTIIQIKNFLKSIPVREQEFHRNYNLHYNKLINILTEYSIVQVKIRICLFNDTNKGRQIILNSGEPCNEILEKINNILGSRIKQELIDFSVDIDNNGNKIFGYISKKIESGSSSDTQWIKKNITLTFINSRPANPSKKLIQTFNEIYKQYNKNGKYIFILQFQLDSSQIDFNVSPDKRDIYIVNEDQIYKKVYDQLLSLHQMINSFQNVALDQSKNSNNNKKKIILQSELILENQNQKQHSQIENDYLNRDQKQIHQDKQQSSNIQQIKIEQQPSTLNINKNGSLLSLFNCKSLQQPINQLKQLSLFSVKNDQQNTNCSTSSVQFFSQKNQNILQNKQFDLKYATISDSNDSQIQYKKENTNFEEQQKLAFTNQVLNYNKSDSTSKISSDSISSNCCEQVNNKIEKDELDIQQDSEVFLSNDDDNDEIIPEKYQQEQDFQPKNFTKQNFLDLNVLGQFNLGFIICCYNNYNELFMIDQHASDEKFNYENLMHNCKFQSQLLINPLKLSITLLEAECLKENRQIFEKIGICFQIDEENLYVNITKIPFLQYGQFTVNDFSEILNNVANQLFGECNYLPNSIKKYLATKACKKSITIGDALDIKQMKNIINNLSNLQSPWNCPHGRPTMIKLPPLSKLINKINQNKQYCF